METFKNHWAAYAIGLAALVAAVIGWHLYPSTKDTYWQGVFVESAGSFWDVALVVILLGLYESNRKNHEKIAELRRRIDDFKKLDDNYGHAIIGSSLRQLAALKITSVDFRGITLSNFRFSSEHGIRSLNGSVFGDFLYFDHPEQWVTDLKNVCFDELDCENVMFGKSEISMCVLEACSFRGTNLQKASFVGVRIMWNPNDVIANEDDWSEICDHTTEGGPIYVQNYTPAFEGADLWGATFDKSRLAHVDFRGAKNVLSASFVGTQGLETCFFDPEIREKLRTA